MHAVVPDRDLVLVRFGRDDGYGTGRSCSATWPGDWTRASGDSDDSTAPGAMAGGPGSSAVTSCDRC